jgi:pimeloyl-ACP methyl ester carboxylesterase
VRAAIREQQRLAFDLQAATEESDVPLQADLATRLGEIDAPALVLVGESDKGDFRAIAERLAAELPNARLAVIPSATHLPSLEQPAAFEAAVRPFLETVG